MERAFDVERSNAILYCQNWQATVDFYRRQIGLPVAFENDWFVEFRLNPLSFLSIADSERATIDHAKGQGVTLTWRVPDIRAAHAELKRRGVNATPIHQKWGALVFHFRDPEGHRIELWQDAPS